MYPNLTLSDLLMIHRFILKLMIIKLIIINFIKRRQLHAIEKVQMRATKLVESVKDMPYEEYVLKVYKLHYMPM